jgi:GNAT superfamily N-acetyltransferase
MDASYTIQFAELEDMDAWMHLVEIVRDSFFPGLETAQQLEAYRQIVIKNIERQTAICARHGSEVVGVLIFSLHSKTLSCMAVHPDHRRKGIATAMIEKMIPLFPEDVDIWVTTFREEDEKGLEPRRLYKKFGFVEDELIEEFDLPQQKFVLRRN